MTARFALPTYELIVRDNVSEEELAFCIEFLEHNIHLIYEFARSGGAESA